MYSRRHEKRGLLRSWLGLTVCALALTATLAAATASAAVTPPKNTTAPTITGTAVVGKILTAHHGSWSGTPPLSYHFQWTRCSATGTACTNIMEAAQSQSYILTSDDL